MDQQWHQWGRGDIWEGQRSPVTYLCVWSVKQWLKVSWQQHEGKKKFSVSCWAFRPSFCGIPLETYLFTVPFLIRDAHGWLFQINLIDFSRIKKPNCPERTISASLQATSWIIYWTVARRRCLLEARTSGLVRPCGHVLEALKNLLFFLYLKPCLLPLCLLSHPKISHYCRQPRGSTGTDQRAPQIIEHLHLQRY